MHRNSGKFESKLFLWGSISKKELAFSPGDIGLTRYNSQKINNVSNDNLRS